MKYRKKPVVIEAIKTELGMNIKKIEEFIDKQYLQIVNGNVFIKTLEGTMEVTPGDYIIKGVNGEYYPYKPDIFKKTYELVTDFQAHETIMDNTIKAINRINKVNH